ncbi:MAG: hypothetical protein QW493_05020, partial [Candidatus Bathyarchaeia archaeon]
LLIKPFQTFSRLLHTDHHHKKAFGGLHCFLADHAAISVIEEKGEGFENGKPETGRFDQPSTSVPPIAS